jgi:hypothetical protein
MKPAVSCTESTAVLESLDEIALFVQCVLMIVKLFEEFTEAWEFWILAQAHNQ